MSAAALLRTISLPTTSTMLTTSQLTRELEGIKTDVVIQAFADQILVLVTQLGKVGSLVRLCMRFYYILCVDSRSNLSVDTSNDAGYSSSTTTRTFSRPFGTFAASAFPLHPAYTRSRTSSIRARANIALLVRVPDRHSPLDSRSGWRIGQWEEGRYCRYCVAEVAGRRVYSARAEGVCRSNENGDRAIEAIMKCND